MKASSSVTSSKSTVASDTLPSFICAPNAQVNEYSLYIKLNLGYWYRALTSGLLALYGNARMLKYVFGVPKIIIRRRFHGI